MRFRSILWLMLAALAGCVSPRVVVNPPQDAAKKPPTTRFGELITVPGQYVAKNPTAPPNDEALFTPRTDAVKPTEHISTLLTPSPAVDPPLVAAFRDYLEGRTDKAVERIKDLEPANQEMILRLFPALKHASKADLRSPGDAAMLGSQLAAAMEATARLSPMTIRKACFVWRVLQFGVFDPVPEKHPFLPGGAGVLYLELQNAPSVAARIPAGGNGYVTRLECSYQLNDTEGKPIAPIKTQPHTEYTRSPVRDYFLKIEFEVPPQPGNYTLVVELKDPATNRRVRHAAELVVVSR